MHSSMQVESTIDNLFRYGPLGTAKQTNKVDSTKLNKKESNKYNLGAMNKKDEPKKMLKLPNLKDLKTIDFKPSIQRLPKVEVKNNIVKPVEKSETEEPCITQHKDIDVLKKIQQIKDLLEMGKQDAQNPDPEIYKKSEAAKKKYLNNLSFLQQRLKDIEYKYFTLPSILNRTMKTFNKPAKETQKKVKIEEATVTTTSSGSLKESEKIKKKKVVVKEDVDPFLPKREAPVPPMLCPKANTSKNNPPFKENKLDKLQLIKKNQELNRKPLKAVNNIEMLFSKDYKFPDNVPKRPTNLDIQKIRHPELLIPKIDETSFQSTSRSSKIDQVQKKITFDLSRSAMKNRVRNLKSKSVDRPDELVDRF